MKRTFSNRCVTIKAKKKMKNNLFMVAAVALVALTACNKEEVAGGNQDVQPVAPTAVVEFTASFSETKTALNAEGKKTLWVETDRIDINGQEFKIKELVDGGLAAKFENVNELPANFAAPFTAKYPYGVEEVPATQTAYAGTFDPAAVLEIATSDNHNLSFTNVTSLLKFQVPAACKTVTISSDDVLAGSNAKTVTVNGSFEAGKTYYAAVLPGTKANFVVRIDGYLSKNAGSVTIDESTIANMKTLPAAVEGTYKVMGLNGDWDNGMKFYKDVDGYLLQDVVLTASSEFKFCQEGGWGRAITLAEGKWSYTYEGNGNLKMPAGTYDIWASANNDAVCIVKAGASRPDFTSANKQLHLLFENYEDCGLYMWQPGGTVYDSWDGAWNNHTAEIEMKQNSTIWTKYRVFSVPYNVVDAKCKFLFKWYDRQSTDYEMEINNDLPFWRKGDTNASREDGSYSLSSRIDIK